MLLQGEVNPCFVQSTVLTHMYAGDNQLTGTIPEVGDNPVLYFLSLGNQRDAALGGSIPDLSGAANLRYLQLGSNGFTGAMPNLPPNLRCGGCWGVCGGGRGGGRHSSMQPAEGSKGASVTAAGAGGSSWNVQWI